MRKVLLLKDQLQEYGKELHDKKSLLIMGRGYQHSTCLEGAFVSPDMLNPKVIRRTGGK